jgi:arginase
VDQLSELGWKVHFDGHHQFEEITATEDPPIGILKNPRYVSRVTEAVARVVGEHASGGRLPVTLGGDHSLVNISFRLRQASILIIYIRRWVQFLEL